MKLPHWVEKEVEMLPAEFTGTMVVECYRGGVTRLDIKTIYTAPKVGEVKT